MDNMSDKERDEYLNSILNEADDSNTESDPEAFNKDNNTVNASETDGEKETDRVQSDSGSTAEELSEAKQNVSEDTEENITERTGSRFASPPDEADADLEEGSGTENSTDIDTDEDDETERRSPKRKKKKHSAGRLIFALILTTVIVCISLGIAVFIIDTVKSITGLDRSSVQMVIDIPENYNTTQIAGILEDNQIIDNADLFVFMAKFKGVDGSFSAGSHILSPNMTYSDIMDELCKHYEEEREEVEVTFPEGITIYDAAAILEEKGVCDSDRFIYIFNSSSFGFDFEKQVTTSTDKFMKMEGYLFPDTYTFYADEEAEVVAKKIYRNFENRLTPDYYGRMKDMGLSLEETVTLASMVQLEGQNTEDMKKIASVFLNRYRSRKFPRLESDPTRKYAEDVVKPNLEVYDEDIVNGYNTYKCQGLPSGPVCNPGLDAISAVLYPADTDYFFFCADIDTGEVFYAETLEEHEENLVKAHLA